MQALKLAVECNNAAVCLLDNRQYDLALNGLRLAAALMHEVTQLVHTAVTENESVQSTVSESDSAPSQSIFDAQRKVIKMKELISQMDRKPIEPTSGMDDFLHTQGFMLSMPSLQDETPCVLHSATVLTNMALTYHLSIPQCLRSEIAWFDNVLTLYEMSYRLAVSVEHCEQSSRILMATLNNIGSIYHECAMYDQSREIFVSLQEYIRHQAKSGDVFFVLEKQEYLLNAMLLVEPRGAAAA